MLLQTGVYGQMKMALKLLCVPILASAMMKVFKLFHSKGTVRSPLVKP